MSKLVIVGTVAFDAIETPFGKTDKVLGGASTYISLAASYFVQPVKAISVVGYDFTKDNPWQKETAFDAFGVKVVEDYRDRQILIRYWLIVTVFALSYGGLKWVYRKRLDSEDEPMTALTSRIPSRMAEAARQ